MSNDEYLAMRLQLVALNELIDDQQRYLNKLTVRRVQLTHEMSKLRDAAHDPR